MHVNFQGKDLAKAIAEFLQGNEDALFYQNKDGVSAAHALAKYADTVTCLDRKTGLPTDVSNPDAVYANEYQEMLKQAIMRNPSIMRLKTKDGITVAHLLAETAGPIANVLKLADAALLTLKTNSGIKVLDILARNYYLSVEEKLKLIPEKLITRDVLQHLIEQIKKCLYLNERCTKDVLALMQHTEKLDQKAIEVIKEKLSKNFDYVIDFLSYSTQEEATFG